MDFQPPDIPDVIRDHILHEVGLRTPELQAYGNVLRLYGENSITKNDFDYWYCRFLDDNDEMDVEVAPQAIEINQNYDLFIRMLSSYYQLRQLLPLRQICRRFRDVIDSNYTPFTDIHVAIGHDYVYVKFNDMRSLYSHKEVREYKYGHKYHDENKTFIEGEGYLTKAFDAVAVALRNQQNILRTFRLSWHPRAKQTNREQTAENVEFFYERVRLLLVNQPFQFAVRDFSIQDTNLPRVLAILQHLSPETIRKFEISDVNYGSWRLGVIGDAEQIMEQMVETPQWTSLSYIQIIHTPINIPLHNFVYCIEFEIAVESVTIEEIIRLKNTLLERPRFRRCKVMTRTEFNFDEIIPFRNMGVLLNGYRHPADNCPYTYRCSIPFTIFQLAVTLRDVSFEINRVQRRQQNVH
ncbi:hypothetical protein GCK72_019628 [Caenorhabditis remanei]|uniref:Uncharacterized protein n=1 Tax=Caenorhabditis remanei TaxID=31234 RepID=A0A6A5GEZ9_CAERE|nr:hypothetical protein GCK72_019628 [Caenorhabditis remanei]KAF1753072.1 hypothetical protein GCK72_019628 [Caenorhabditis remanei]